MKKTIIALAALAATGAFAQSSVTIGGIIDQAYSSVEQNNRAGTQNTKQVGFGDGGWAGSRLIFRGSEDMGGGMKANFWLEQGISPSDGNGFDYRNGGNSPQMLNGAGMTNQNRQSWVGLSGGFGEVRLGRLYGATYDMYTNKGFINGEFTGTGNAGAPLGARTKGISYQSPVMNGFDVYLTYGGANNDTIDTNSTQDQASGFKIKKTAFTTARVMYNKGPLALGFSNESNSEECATNAAALTNFFGAAVAAQACTDPQVAHNSTSNTLLAGYNFGVVNANVIMLNKTSVATTGTSTATEFRQLNVKIPLGAKAEARFTTNTSKATSGTASDWTGSLIGLNYKLSPRTVAYVFMGQQEDTTATDAVTMKEKRTAIGISHSF